MSDEHFSHIFSWCVKAGENCTLSEGFASGEELEDAVVEFIRVIRHQPIPILEQNYLYDYSTLMTMIYDATYGQSLWPEMVTTLAGLMGVGNSSKPAVHRRQEEGGEEVPEGGEVGDETVLLAAAAPLFHLRGIQCADSDARSATLEEFAPAAEQVMATSKRLGDAFIGLFATCNQWTIEPKERYTGDFNVKTKNPVLLVGTSYDAQTPIVSAHNVSATFEGSTVLEVDGYGVSNSIFPATTTLPCAPLSSITCHCPLASSSTRLS